MKVIDYKKFDINNIIYQEPVKTAGGCLLSKTLYGYNSEEIPIYIQTPRLKNVSNLEISDSRTYIELELDKQHINFYEFINNVDDHNISKTHSRSEDWFQQKLPMDVIDDFYKANIKMRKYNKSPVIKFKIPLYKNKTKKGCDIFGDDLKPIDISEVKKDVEVICILELQGIKFFKQRFEAEWNVVQLRAYLKPNISRECLINEDFLSDNEDNDIVEEEPKENVKNIEIKVSQTNDTKINEIIKVSKNNEESELNSEPIKEEEAVEEAVEEVEAVEEAVEEAVVEVEAVEAVEAVENKTTIDNKNIEIEIPEDNTEEESHNLEESENNNNNSESESESESDLESDYNSDNDNIQDYYSDNFSDEDEICEGLDKHLEEINFAEDEEEEQENSHTIEAPQSDSEIESEADEAEEELKADNLELKAENTIEPVNNSAENKQYLNQNIGDLISEIEKLKKIAFDKDEEVNQLKSKYKNLYSELNI